MVALLHPTHSDVSPAAAHAARPRPRHLRLVKAQSKTSADPLSVLAVVAVIATLLLVVLVRGVQGAPPASDWQSLADSSTPAISASAPAVAGESALTVTVVEGDSWATIAARVAPGVDPVEFARSLASSNGGYQLQAGQVLVIPAID